MIFLSCPYDSIRACEECKEKYSLPFDWCCLLVCGEIEVCKGCKCGIYKEVEENNA